MTVEIQSMTGETAELEADEWSSVRELKRRVADLWELIPECISILTVEDMATLEDHEYLGAWRPEDSGTLVVMVIVSLDAVQQRLSSRHPAVRAVSMKTLARLTPRGDETTVDDLTQRLSDPHPAVRQVALQMIMQVADWDERTMALITRCLEDGDEVVQLEALTAMMQIAPETEALSDDLRLAVNQCLGDDSRRVRLAAADVLLERAKNPADTEQIVQAIRGHLRGGVEAIPRQEAALSIYAKLVAKGDAVALQDVSDILQSNCPSAVRMRALQALGQIAEEGDSFALHLMYRDLGDQTREVRMAAAEALGLVAARGDAACEEYLLSALQSGRDARCTDLRLAALGALACVGTLGNAALTASLFECFESKETAEREAAVKALGCIVASGGDSDDRSPLIAAVCGYLEHAKADLRHAAAQALPLVAHAGDAGVLAVICEHLTDTQIRVRQALVDALVQLTHRGDVCTVAALKALEEHRQAQVRAAATEALERLPVSPESPDGIGAHEA